MSAEFDTSSREEFVDYYGKQSDKQETWDHFERVYKGLIALRKGNYTPSRTAPIPGAKP